MYVGSIWLTCIALLTVVTPLWGMFSCYAPFMDGKIRLSDLRQEHQEMEALEEDVCFESECFYMRACKVKEGRGRGLGKLLDGGERALARSIGRR